MSAIGTLANKQWKKPTARSLMFSLMSFASVLHSPMHLSGSNWYTSLSRHFIASLMAIVAFSTGNSVFGSIRYVFSWWIFLMRRPKASTTGPMLVLRRAVGSLPVDAILSVLCGQYRPIVQTVSRTTLPLSRSYRITDVIIKRCQPKNADNAPAVTSSSYTCNGAGLNLR